MLPQKPQIIRVDAGRPAKTAIREVARRLRDWSLAIIPTDTVYGIAADFTDPAGEEKICRAKRRDRHKPIPVLVSGVGKALELGAAFSDKAMELARRFWPGPLTLVVPTGERFEGFRVPDHKVTLALLDETGGALRVTSANISGSRPALTAKEAIAALGGCIEVALDAGRSPAGEPSTVVKVTAGKYEILREGAVPARRIHDLMAMKLRILFVCTGNVCRSPMAEHMLREKLGGGSCWTVSSAGLSAMNGMKPTWDAVSTMDEHGIDLRAHRSRPLTQELVDSSSLIVVMTNAHRQEMNRLYPSLSGKVFLLKSFSKDRKDEEVSDPMGAATEAYREVYEDIKRALPGLLAYMKKFNG